MITVVDKLECFKIDRYYQGNLTVQNNRSKNCLAFKIKTTNNHEINVNPNIGLIKDQGENIIVRCEKFQTNAKLLILVKDISDRIITNLDKNQISQIFEEYGNGPEIEKKKIEIITLDQYNQQTKQSNIINQSLSQLKFGEESAFLQQDFNYEQTAVQKKQQQTYPQQYQVRNSYSNSEVPNNTSRLSEQKVLTQTTFQMPKQTPSKQSSSSQNNILFDQPPKPQSYPYQPQQPKQQQQQFTLDKDPEEDLKIKKLNFSIQQLNIEYNNLLQEQQTLEKNKQLLLKNETFQEQEQIFVGSQHIFFSALICFLIGYIVAN